MRRSFFCKNQCISTRESKKSNLFKLRISNSLSVGRYVEKNILTKSCKCMKPIVINKLYKLIITYTVFVCIHLPSLHLWPLWHYINDILPTSTQWDNPLLQSADSNLFHLKEMSFSVQETCWAELSPKIGPIPPWSNPSFPAPTGLKDLMGECYFMIPWSWKKAIPDTKRIPTSKPVIAYIYLLSMNLFIHFGIIIFLPNLLVVSIKSGFTYTTKNKALITNPFSKKKTKRKKNPNDNQPTNQPTNQSINLYLEEDFSNQPTTIRIQVAKLEHRSDPSTWAASMLLPHQTVPGNMFQ